MSPRGAGAAKLTKYWSFVFAPYGSFATEVVVDGIVNLFAICVDLELHRSVGCAFAAIVISIQPRAVRGVRVPIFVFTGFFLLHIPVVTASLTDVTEPGPIVRLVQLANSDPGDTHRIIVCVNTYVVRLNASLVLVNDIICKVSRANVAPISLAYT